MLALAKPILLRISEHFMNCV